MLALALLKDECNPTCGRAGGGLAAISSTVAVVPEAELVWPVGVPTALHTDRPLLAVRGTIRLCRW